VRLACVDHPITKKHGVYRDLPNILGFSKETERRMNSKKFDNLLIISDIDGTLLSMTKL
jgi:hypothetical protein